MFARWQKLRDSGAGYRMIFLALLTAAVAPGLCLLFYFYLRDQYDAEPIGMVAKMFFMGLVIVFPTMVFQRALVLGFGENPFLYSFIYSAGIEEFFKWFRWNHKILRTLSKSP